MHDYNSSQSNMSKLAIFKINQGDFDQGFSVTLQIWENGELLQEDTSSLPGDLRIPQLYQDWQNKYYTWLDLGATNNQATDNQATDNQATDNQATDNQATDNNSEPVRKITFPDEPDPEKERRENCKRSSKALEAQLQKWFDQESSRSLKMDVLDRTSEHDSIRIIFQTENEHLRKLPLHLWDLLKHRRKKAEVVLSARHQTCSRDNLENPVKILVILGSSEGINVNRDRDLLNELPRATVTLLEKPQQEELFEHLYDQRWDILFFAGHSFDGEIKLNDNESLSLQKLEYALDEAIQNGLKLAIFNSCDGLKLARHLEKLNIPQVIVMREPVPDLVAQEFLKRFLKFFSEGKSLYIAVRKAREWLQGRENKFPCATWLPIMCQNPAAPELMWPPPPEIRLSETSSPLKQLLNLIRQNRGKLALGLAAAIAIAVVYFNDKIPPKSLSVPPVKFSWGEELLTSPSTNSDKPKCNEAYTKKAEGEKAFEEKNFSEAVEHFRSFLEQCPYDPEARIYLNNAQAEYSGNPIKIAVSVPIDTRKLSPFISQGILRGVAQAQEELNKQGGINNRLLKIGIADDQGEPETVEKVANLFVKNDDILGVIGHFSSDTTLQAGKIYERGKLVVISPTSTAVRGTNTEDDEVNFSPYVFRTATTDATAAKDLVNYMRDTLNYTKAAIVYENDNLYSRSLRRQFKEQLKAKEGTVVSDANSECNLSSTTFHPNRCVEEAIDNDAQVLLLAPSTKLSNDARQIVWNNSQHQTPLSLLGGDAVYGTDTLENAGTAVEGMVIALSWHRNEDNPSQFEQEAQKLWGEDIYLQTAMAYDATQALIEGLKVLEQQERNFTREGLKQALSSPDFSAKGATGTVEFDSSGDRKLFNGIGVLVQVQLDPDSDSETGYKYELLQQPNRDSTINND